MAAKTSAALPVLVVDVVLAINDSSYWPICRVRIIMLLAVFMTSTLL